MSDALLSAVPRSTHLITDSCCQGSLCQWTEGAVGFSWTQRALPSLSAATLLTLGLHTYLLHPSTTHILIHPHFCVGFRVLCHVAGRRSYWGHVVMDDYLASSSR